MPKTICKICDNTEFENINGRYYCTICNSQHHGVFDMEFSDEETDHKGTHQLKTAAGAAKNATKVEQDENERNVDANYSTFHVFNHLLKAQADDLVKLGVNPLIKKIIFEIWSKYLNKLKLAFCNDLEHRKKGSNIKWLRDKRYFEIYELKLEHEMEQEQKMETENLSETSILSATALDADDLGNEMANESPQQTETSQLEADESAPGPVVEPDSENNTGSSHESVAEEYDETELEDNTLMQDKLKRANLLLTKFEWIRMPHTVAILNLALLVLKSPVLVTDLVRLIYDGKISYFNIETVLPESMQFTYDRDSLMFNVTSLPKCEYLRYLTAKLGQYLNVGSIQIISLEQVTARFVVDLNLPRDLIVIIRLLMQKIQPVTRLNFSKAENINIEETALSYLYLAIVIMFEYDANSHPTAGSIPSSDLFRLEDWIKAMQNTIFDAERRIAGCGIEEVKSMADLEALKISSFNHRHKINTKPYISKFRRVLVHKALRAPLDTFGLDGASRKGEETKTNDQSHLFYLYQRDQAVNPSVPQFAFQKIDSYMSSEKLRLLTVRDAKLSSKKYQDFIGEYFLLDNKEDLGRYVIGLESNTLYWLLDMFHQLSQTRSPFKMYKRISKMFDRL